MIMLMGSALVTCQAWGFCEELSHLHSRKPQSDSEHPCATAAIRLGVGFSYFHIGWFEALGCPSRKKDLAMEQRFM